MAEAPPSYYPDSKKSGSKLWLWVLIAVLAFCGLGAIGVYFLVKSVAGQGIALISCAANADLARNAILAYAKDHDGVLPPAESWQDDIRPNYEKLYEKLASEMKIKDMPDWLKFDISKPGQVISCSVGPETTTGFAYNSLLAQKKLDEITDHDKTILVWETMNPEYNANGDPATRGKPGEKFKIFGQEREYIDMMIEGESDFLQSGNSEFDFDTNPEDGTVKEEAPAENPDPKPKEEVK